MKERNLPENWKRDYVEFFRKNYVPRLDGAIQRYFSINYNKPEDIGEITSKLENLLFSLCSGDLPLKTRDTRHFSVTYTPGLYETMGDALQDFLIQSGISQAEAASALRISTKTITKLIKGSVSNESRAKKYWNKNVHRIKRRFLHVFTIEEKYVPDFMKLPLSEEEK